MDPKYLILMIAFATLEINVTGRRQSDKRRKSNKSYSHYVNICDMVDRVAKVHCYCNKTEINSATKADCWVFNGGIAEDDPFWSNFYSQSKIEILSFNVRVDGGLTYIPAKVIVRLEHLQSINIKYANIFIVPPFAFTNSTTLREISLQNNKIMKLEKMAFAHLIMLSNVSLVENQIPELNTDVFYVLPNLQRLNLSNNTITVLHDGCFKHLSNLIRLDLDNNLLTVVVRETFQGLSNLITLHMKNNKLDMIGDLALVELWSLQELYLDGNKIEYISEQAFGGLRQLKKLSLVNNKLSVLDDGVLNDNLKLNVLDLRNNNLETLRQEAVQNVLENMNSNYALISLEGNKLRCDCRLSWLQKLKNDTRSQGIKASLNRLLCVMDNKLKNNLGVKVEKFENSQKINPSMYKKDYETEEDIDDGKTYNDTTPDKDGESDGSKIQYRRKLLKIPTGMLPCPNRLGYEAPYSPPTQDEVINYKTSSGDSLRYFSWQSLIVVMLVLLQSKQYCAM